MLFPVYARVHDHDNDDGDDDDHHLDADFRSRKVSSSADWTWRLSWEIPAMKFLHTADWQIGMKADFVGRRAEDSRRANLGRTQVGGFSQRRAG